MLNDIDFTTLNDRLNSTNCAGVRAFYVAQAVADACEVGEKLNATQLAERLKISSTTSCVALQILTYQGFAIHKPRRSYIRTDKRGEVVDPQRFRSNHDNN